MKKILLLLAFATATCAMATRPMRQVITLSDGRTVTLQKQTTACPSDGAVNGRLEVKRRSFATTDPTGLGVYGKSAKGTLPSVGEREIPIVMVAFADKGFMEGTTKTKVERLFNEEGYNDLDGGEGSSQKAAGSVRDYFSYNSEGMFRPHFTVVDSVTLDGGYASYGRNNSSGSDTNMSGFINESLTKTTANGTDFKPYVDEATGGVPLVVFFFAGPGEHASYEEGCEDYMWPKYMSTSRSVNGVKFTSCFVGNEVMQDYAPAEDYEQTGHVLVTGQHIAGIGVLIHELGHALGLPDEYDTKYQTPLRPTPDYWSVMDYGQYQENGYRPMQYSAYERCCLGWLELKELKPESRLVSIAPHEAYIVRNPEADNQYYILETRYENPWYRSARFGTGMMVWQINYQQNLWTGNTPNNALDNQCIHVVPADGQWQSNATRKQWSEFRGDLYPGDSDTSTSPLGRPYTTAEFYGLPIFRITDDGEGNVSFFTMTDGVKGVSTETAARQTQNVRHDLNTWIYIKDNRKYLNHK